MSVNMYDLGILSSVTAGSTVTVLEAYDSRDGIFRYRPTDDANLTIKLEGSEDNSTWADVQTISDPDHPYEYKVTMKPYMRLNCSAYTAGGAGGSIEPL